MLLQRSHFAIKKCPARHPNRANAASPCLLRDVVSLQRFRASRVRGPSLRHFFEGKLPDRVSGLGGQFFGLGSPPPVIFRPRIHRNLTTRAQFRSQNGLSGAA